MRAQASGDRRQSLLAVSPSADELIRLTRSGRSRMAHMGQKRKFRISPRRDCSHLAESGRFEVTSRVRDLRFSRPVHSTALPPLRLIPINSLEGFYQAAASSLGPDVSILFPSSRISLA